MSKYYNQSFCETNNNYSVIIDDDGDVAYGYLIEDEKIIGDVWLYNQGVTPISADWVNGKKIPFLNPLDFIIENIKPINNNNEIRFVWYLSNDTMSLYKVEIYIRDKSIAYMIPGSKPGWSAVVYKDGPLAKRWK